MTGRAGAVAGRALGAVVAAVAGRAVSLPETLLSRWPELGGARWRRGGLPPRVGGWVLGLSCVDGIALGRTIWVGDQAPLDPALLLHEIRHVQQFESEPWFRVRYVIETLRRGYRANRFEEDARAYAERRATNETAPDPRGSGAVRCDGLF